MKVVYLGRESRRSNSLPEETEDIIELLSNNWDDYGYETTFDLLDADVYLDYFNKTFAKQLAKTVVKEADLPKGDRIVHRIERYLDEKSIKLRPSGGFNHYAVAATFGSSPPKAVSADMLKRFTALFESLNKAI